jgi:hypothetical protein
MMTINWEELKQEIILETKDIIASDKNIKLSEVVDLFLEVIQYQISLDELSGIPARMPYALQKILLEPVNRIEKITCFPDVGRFELYLRKMLYLVKPAEYQTLVDAKDGLAMIISYLNLNPNNINYNSITLSPERSTHFAEHLLKSYKLRNKESHDCIEWSSSRLYNELKSVLVFLLYSTYRYQRELKIRINPFDVSSYLEQEKKEIRKGIETIFVHTDGKEKISEIELSAKKLEGSQEEDADNEFADVDSNREGTVEYLKQTVKERKMFLLGDVGMGKTTTLRHLVLMDIEAAISDKKKSIPIYLELKNLNQKDILSTKFQAKLGIDRELAENLFKDGKINFYLDGINEIENNIKSNILKQIKGLLNDYPKNFFLISSRPKYYDKQFEDDTIYRTIPVFALQRLGIKQIEEFLDKNGVEVKNYILQEINANERLFRIVQVPLMLKILIEIVKKEQKIPSDKGKIIRVFFSNLYDREMAQTFDFDKDRFRLLISYLSFKSRELTDSNTSLDLYDFIIPILNDGKNEFGIEMDNLAFLNKAVDLNILVEDKNEYSFSHEIFQEYYAAEYIHIRKTEHVLLNKYSNTTEGAWTEVLKFYADLFEDISAKNKFLETITGIDSLLAAQCVMSSTKQNESAEKEIISKVRPNLITTDNEINQIVFDSMIELKQIDDIMPLFSSANASELPFLKSRIPMLFDLNKEKLTIVLNGLLCKNASVYLKEINNYFLTANELLKEDLFVDYALKVFKDSTIKPKHILDFLRLKPEISLSFDKANLERFLFEISNYDDLLFITKKFKIEIHIKDFVTKYIAHKTEIEIDNRECHLIFNLIKDDEEFKKTDLDLFIKYYLQSSNQNLMILSFMLIITHMDSFNYELKSIHRSIVQSKYRNKKFDNYDSYYKTVTDMKKNIHDEELKSNIQSFKGICTHVVVVSKWRYHYALRAINGKNYPIKSILLPFDEAESINIGDEIEVRIIYVDKINQRLYASQKQLNQLNSQMAFDSEYLDIIKKGDKIICKVEYYQNDINKGIMLIPKGISKRSIQCLLHKDFNDIERRKKLDPTHEFTVVGLKNSEVAIVYPSNMIDEI